MMKAQRSFVSAEHRTSDYLAAVKALRDLDSGLRTRAYAEAVCQDHLDSWAKSRHLKPSSSYPCRRLLFGKRCGRGSRAGCQDHELPASDHLSVWQINGHHVIVSQPYGIRDSWLNELASLKVQGVHIEIDAWPAWHFPGSVLHLAFWSAPAWDAYMDRITKLQDGSP